MVAKKYDFQKQIAILMSLALLTASSSFAQEGQNAVSKAKTMHDLHREAISKYEKNGATEFDNFHDQFLILGRYGFPNINGTRFGLKLSAEDFNNPQALAKYSQKLQQLEENERLAINAEVERTGKSWNEVHSEMVLGKPFSLGDIMDAPNDAEMKALRAREEDRLSRFNAFMKAGYYKYFLSKLNESGDEDAFVNVCVNVDRQSEVLGNNDFRTSRKEIRKMTRLKSEEMLSELDAGSYESPVFNRPIASYSCDLMVSVNEQALSQLNQNKFVASFIHPDVITANLNDSIISD